MQITIATAGDEHDSLQTETDFYAFHRVDIFLEEGVDVGDELSVEGVVGRQWAGSITAFWEDAIVLGGEELEGTIDEVSKTVQRLVSVQTRLFDITFSGGRYCWQRSIKQWRRSGTSDMQDADLLHNPPRRTWHQKFPDVWREGSTAIRKQEFRSL